jgi:ABC-2 type transport system permease protein
MTATALGHPGGIARSERVTQLRVIHSEWIKLRSLRSTVYTLVISVVATVGLGLMFSTIIASRWSRFSAAERLRFNPTAASLRGVLIAQLAIGVLGVLMITGEYSTGMIRATLGAAPTRLPVLWAKTLVFGAIAAGVSIIASLAAFLAGQAVLGSHHIQARLSDPGVARAVVGAGLYLTVVGLLGIALGFIIRNTAGAITALFGLLLILPGLAQALPSDWAARIDPYLPSNAGQAIMDVHRTAGDLAPWAGFAVFCGYTAAALIAAAVMLSRRDA